MRTILVAATAALALSACQKGTSTSQTSTQSSAAPSPAAGQPHRRAGLWQTSVTVDGHSSPMGAMKLCVDAAMEAKSTAFHPSAPASLGGSVHCAYPAPSRGADGSWQVNVTCPLTGGGQTVTKVTATGDWSSAYHVHSETDTTGASISVANGHHVTDMDAKWLGPCPDGMAGGDMELANGMKISGGKLAGAAAMIHGMTGGGSSSAGQ